MHRGGVSEESAAQGEKRERERKLGHVLSTMIKVDYSSRQEVDLVYVVLSRVRD